VKAATKAFVAAVRQACGFGETGVELVERSSCQTWPASMMLMPRLLSRHAPAKAGANRTVVTFSLDKQISNLRLFP
jgi:hypothetical protein